MVCFATQVEQALARHQALQRHRKDRSLIGDLGELHMRLLRLQTALDKFVARPRSQLGRDPFEARLVDLASEIGSLRMVVRDLNGPMRRLLADHCGNVGLAASSLIAAASLRRGRE